MREIAVRSINQGLTSVSLSFDSIGDRKRRTKNKKIKNKIGPILFLYCTYSIYLIHLFDFYFDLLHTDEYSLVRFIRLTSSKLLAVANELTISS